MHGRIGERRRAQRKGKYSFRDKVKEKSSNGPRDSREAKLKDTTKSKKPKNQRDFEDPRLHLHLHLHFKKRKTKKKLTDHPQP
jgi:hypothetical protein